MSYEEILKEVNAKKRARIKERQIKEFKNSLTKFMKKNGGIVLGTAVLLNASIIGMGAIPAYAMVTEKLEVSTNEVLEEETEEVTDEVEIEVNYEKITESAKDNKLKEVKEKEATKVKKNKKTKKQIKEEKEKKKQEDLEKQKLLKWEKEKKYCLSQKKNVYDNWRTNRGKGISNSATRTHMSYTAVTSKSSRQYRVLRNVKAWSDTSTGLRMYEDRYCVAVGIKYGKAGDKIDLVMEDGSVVKAIIGDIKANKDTDETHMFQKDDGSIVELITDGTPYNRKRVPSVLKQRIKAIVNVEGKEF